MFAAHRPLRAAAGLRWPPSAWSAPRAATSPRTQRPNPTTTTTEATTTTESTTTTEATTTSAPQTPTNDSEFCQRTIALIGSSSRQPPTSRPGPRPAPDGIRGPVDVYVETLNANDGDAVAVLDDPEGAEAINAIAAFPRARDCGTPSRASRIDGEPSQLTGRLTTKWAGPLIMNWAWVTAIATRLR